MENIDYVLDPWCVDPPTAVIKLPDELPTGQDLATFISAEVMPLFETERRRLERLHFWGTGKQPMDIRHHGRNQEKRVLQRFARNPWLRLMVSTFAQQLVVDGFRRDGSTENEQAWDSWQANNMSSQQFTINRTTSIYGYSYVRVTRGLSPFSKEPMAVMRAVDPMNAFGIYSDPYGDEYPQYLLEKRFDGTYWWWTSESYSIFNKDGKDWKFIKEVAHDYQVVPFVRYINEIDAKGRCWGDVEPLIEIAARMDKTVLDRLLVQHYNSFKIRWATGLEQPDSEEEARAGAMQLKHGDMLISSNDQAKFGVLSETDMGPFIESYKSDLESFLTNAQLPPDLAGQVANIAADALEGARRSSYQKLYEKQIMAGQSHAQTLRLSAFIEGRLEDANDFTAKVHWQDVQVKSLAQFADAWGKICDQLGYPKQLVWGLIPGIDQSDVERAKDNFFNDTGEEGKLNKYLREMGIKPMGQSPGPGGPNSTQNQPPPNVQ